ncbi:arrestin domain-containing protein 3-like [Uranotaenia lowii]|uniref:arrestin domain-containing protein 3-like n=1 Tax=Uranotaenia lowii TaxID=190385 RepID=UPI00247A3F31|nr:arrestin domain-containing protein 3-like [Uranotaenia lowii]XP_055613610.1 arrestin domain-containing protein 3-like [Uranotaenia lowii]
MPKEKASKTVVCDIRFDNNPNGIFNAGDVVSGSVTLTLTQLKKVKGVYLLITGFAETFWNDKVPHGPKNKKMKANFKGREEFITHKTYLIGSDTLTNPIDIPIGSASYNFQIPIPTTAPTSMEGRYGHIRYSVKVTLERPWKHDQNFQMPFTVLAKIDFDENSPVIKRVYKVEDQIRFYCWICKSDPLMVAASIPKTGYIPGEAIPLKIDVNNLSKEDVSEIVVKFKKVIKYISQIQVIEDTQVYSESHLLKYETLEIQTTQSVAKQTNSTIEKNFVVGPLSPTEDRNCKVIKIGYELDILVKPKLSTQKIELVIPVLIGSVSPKSEEAVSFVRSSGLEKLAAGLNREQPTAPPPPYVESPDSPYPIATLQQAYEREFSSDENDFKD